MKTIDIAIIAAAAGGVFLLLRYGIKPAAASSVPPGSQYGNSALIDFPIRNAFQEPAGDFFRDAARQRAADLLGSAPAQGTYAV